MDWDTDLPKEEKEQWVGWLLELADETGVTMRRTVRPEGAIGDPVLAGFADASIEAMCAVVYCVWDSTEGPKSNLLLSKVQVTAVNGKTVPRAELQAMVILTRILRQLSPQLSRLKE